MSSSNTSGRLTTEASADDLDIVLRILRGNSHNPNCDPDLPPMHAVWWLTQFIDRPILQAVLQPIGPAPAIGPPPTQANCYEHRRHPQDQGPAHCRVDRTAPAT